MLIGDVGDVIHLLRPEQRLPLNATDALFHAWAVAKHELTPSAHHFSFGGNSSSKDAWVTVIAAPNRARASEGVFVMRGRRG